MSDKGEKPSGFAGALNQPAEVNVERCGDAKLFSISCQAGIIVDYKTSGQRFRAASSRGVLRSNSTVGQNSGAN